MRKKIENYPFRVGENFVLSSSFDLFFKLNKTNLK